MIYVRAVGIALAIWSAAVLTTAFTGVLRLRRSFFDSGKSVRLRVDRKGQLFIFVWAAELICGLALIVLSYE